MNYINRPKPAYTQEERIKYLEESIRELRIEKDRIRKEKGELRQKLLKMQKYQDELIRVKENKELLEENKKLKDDLRIAQGLVEKYEEIEIKMGKENKNLKLIQETNEKQLKNDIKERDELREENKKLKEQLDKLKGFQIYL